MENSNRKLKKHYLLFEIDRMTGKKIYHCGFDSKYKAYKMKKEWKELSNNTFHVEITYIWEIVKK